jgi:hypothetical protein
MLGCGSRQFVKTQDFTRRVGEHTTALGNHEFFIAVWAKQKMEATQYKSKNSERTAENTVVSNLTPPEVLKTAEQIEARLGLLCHKNSFSSDTRFRPPTFIRNSCFGTTHARSRSLLFQNPTQPQKSVNLPRHDTRVFARTFLFRSPSRWHFQRQQRDTYSRP